MSQSRIKVLFFAEGATLAHVVRPFALARELDSRLFDVTFCRPSEFHWLTTGASCSLQDLVVQDRSVFARRLNYGLPLYDFKTLKSYVADDLRLIDSVKPDVVVGDFRLSLSVSARLRSVPYITICDAYWSPERSLNPPLPVLGFTPYVPLRLAEFLFSRVSGLALKLHAMPIERLRAHYGLPSFGHDLRYCYSDADLRLFPNFSLLYPDVRAGDGTAFIPPITWFPDTVAVPIEFEADRPHIYVTMGSSGNPQVLERIVPVLEETGHSIVITTAGKPLTFRPDSAKTRVFDYLPGEMVCRNARLVICNGGSPTTNQALIKGIPVLGIAQNMDQFLNMQAIECFGAGLVIRADRAKAARLSNVVEVLLNQHSFAKRAQDLAASVQGASAASTLARHISVLSG